MCGRVGGFLKVCTMEEDKTQWRYECDGIILHIYGTLIEEVNFKISTGRMTGILCEHDNLNLDSQSCVKKDTLGVYNSSAPVER